ncbi:MAG: trypsin-like peptidase domain-containing protein [Rhizobacter sp.]|nr:trypsin-like peptidase domain-containing protein [Rhizobacter sp.]
MSLRQALAAALLVSAASAVCAHEVQGAKSQASPPALPALLVRAETALKAGDANAARDAFEQAAALRHAADIEIGWVRAQMQAGEYRRALAFAAHIAGAHPHEGQGAALYAWLLFLGGQEAVASDALARAQLRLPSDALLSSVKTRLGAPNAAPPSAPFFAPQPLGDSVPAQARSVGNAILLPDARHAVAPLALIDGGGSLWLRNGLGRTVRAELLRSDAASGLAVLQLATPLDAPATLALAPREPFPGSPGLVVGYRVEADALPAWPKLSTGFLGAAMPDATQRRLGIDVPAGSAGSPVFDVAGRLAGIVLPPSAPGQPGLGRVASLRGVAQQEWPAPAASATTPPAMPVDQLYERALRSSLQLIRAD